MKPGRGQGRAALARSVAASVGVPASLLPVLPILFRGMESLGSEPRTVLSILTPYAVPVRARVLDLACGKGAVAIAIAGRFGCCVTGVDACSEFVDHAGARAARLGLGARCRFRTGDVRGWTSRTRFDLTLMLGLFGVRRAARIARAHTRRGGLYLLDDAFAFSARARAAGVPTLDEIRAALEGRGDTILAEHVPSRESTQRLHAGVCRRIADNAARAARVHPSLAAELCAYVKQQRAATRSLAGPLRPALWLVRRSSRRA